MSTETLDIYGTLGDDMADFMDAHSVPDISAWVAFQHPCPSAIHTAEQELQKRVLEEAFDDVRKARLMKARNPLADQERRYQDAVAWFCDTSEPDWPFSFQSICASLDLDADVVREQAMREASKVVQKAA